MEIISMSSIYHVKLVARKNKILTMGQIGALRSFTGDFFFVFKSQPFSAKSVFPKFEESQKKIPHTGDTESLDRYG